MIKAVAKIVVLLLFVAGSLNLLAKPPIDRIENSILARSFIDLSSIYKLCTEQAEDLLKAENQLKRKQINNLFKKLFNLSDFNLSLILKKVKNLTAKGFFIPSGGLYFVINSDYEPFMQVDAKVHPVEFYQYLFNLFESPAELKAFKKNNEIVEIRIPLQNFNLIFQILPDGLRFYSDKSKASLKGCLPEKSDSLLEFELDFNKVKELLAARNVVSQQAICVRNLIKINDALNMYLLKNGKSMNKLDLNLLKEKGSLAGLPHCPAGGVYALDDADKNLSVCSVHGSIRNPTDIKLNHEKMVDPRIEAFKAFHFLIKNNSIILKTGFNDEAALQQWKAIARQQILTLKYIVLNKLSETADEEKVSIIDTLEAIKCEIAKGRLQIKLDKINETFLATGIISATGNLMQMIMPRYKRARKFARAGQCAANRRMLKLTTEMFVSDNPEENVTLEKLLANEYLENLPQCPDGGKYEIIDASEIKCSIHGF
ncbi:MAG: hypothetical protein ACQETH_08335 [Candidatus Rifleibacteriota bacterium]